jgi:hypothetical protein
VICANLRQVYATVETVAGQIQGDSKMSVNKTTATKKLTQAEFDAERSSIRKEANRLLVEVRALRAMLIPIQADQAETGRRIRAMIQEIDEAP